MTIPDLLKLLFSTFPPASSGEQETQLEAYALALDGHDVRDIEAAVHKLIRGEVAGHNPSFAPSAAMLGSVVRERMNDRLDSEHRRRPPALPKPDVVRTPESMARVAAMTKRAVEGLASAMLTVDAADARRRQKFQDRVQARFDPQSEREMAERLGYSLADPRDDEGDMGGRAA